MPEWPVASNIRLRKSEVFETGPEGPELEN